MARFRCQCLIPRLWWWRSPFGWAGHNPSVTSRCWSTWYSEWPWTNADRFLCLWDSNLRNRKLARTPFWKLWPRSQLQLDGFRDIDILDRNNSRWCLWLWLKAYPWCSTVRGRDEAWGLGSNKGKMPKWISFYNLDRFSRIAGLPVSYYSSSIYAINRWLYSSFVRIS